VEGVKLYYKVTVVYLGMIRLCVSILLFSILSGCVSPPENNEDATEENTQAPAVITEVRDAVASMPAASFRKKTPNNLNDWYFSVDLFETKKRFDYVVKMRYEEAAGVDTISFPNLGQEPKPVLQQGKSEFSCVIGFLDQEGKFREYKEVSFAKDRLKITTLKYYTVSGGNK
jgi:hypothetical protein